MTTSEDEAQAILELFEILRPVEGWMHGELPPVQDGSAFTTDDERMHPHEVSQAVHHALNIAVDHLHCLQMALTGNGPQRLDLHAYAPFTLLRGALENAATAVWIAHPAHRNDRILRRARLEASNIRAAETMLKEAGEPASSLVEERKILLEDIVTKAGTRLSVASDRLSPSEIMKDAGDYAGLREGDRHLAFLFWKMCSAVAHGDRWALTFLDIEKLSSITKGADHVRVTAPAHTVLSGARAALAMIKAGRHLWIARSQLHR